MGGDKNVELVRAGYAAFSTGDMATLNDLFAEDAVWHVRAAVRCPERSKGEMRSSPFSVRL